jgi:hypothetical protein
MRMLQGDIDGRVWLCGAGFRIYLAQPFEVEDWQRAGVPGPIRVQQFTVDRLQPVERFNDPGSEVPGQGVPLDVGRLMDDVAKTRAKVGG